MDKTLTPVLIWLKIFVSVSNAEELTTTLIIRVVGYQYRHKYNKTLIHWFRMGYIWHFNPTFDGNNCPEVSIRGIVPASGAVKDRAIPLTIIELVYSSIFIN